MWDSDYDCTEQFFLSGYLITLLSIKARFCAALFRNLFSSSGTIVYMVLPPLLDRTKLKDAINQPSGIYLYNFQAGDFAETKKMLKLK